jgi:hypothetical protein
MTVDEKCVVEFNGMSIDPSRIENSRLASVFRERVHDGNKFLFWYCDHTDHPTGGSNYSDYSDVRSNHYDHKDNHSDTRSGYSECDGYGHDFGHSDHTDKHR